MLASHYAPDARLLLVQPAEQAARVASLRAEGKRVGVLAFEPGSAMADASFAWSLCRARQFCERRYRQRFSLDSCFAGA